MSCKVVSEAEYNENVQDLVYNVVGFFLWNGNSANTNVWGGGNGLVEDIEEDVELLVL